MNALKQDIRSMYPNANADEIIAAMRGFRPIFGDMTRQQLMLLAIRAYNSLHA